MMLICGQCGNSHMVLDGRMANLRGVSNFI